MAGVVKSLICNFVAVAVGCAFDVEGNAVLVVAEDLGESGVSLLLELGLFVAVLVCNLDNAYDLLECGSYGLEDVSGSSE